MFEYLIAGHIVGRQTFFKCQFEGWLDSWRIFFFAGGPLIVFHSCLALQKTATAALLWEAGFFLFALGVGVYLESTKLAGG